AIGMVLVVAPYVFEPRIDACRYLARAGLVGVGCRERYGMVEIAVVLVVRQYENRLCPNLGVLREDIHHLAYIPRAKPGRIGVVRKQLRRYQPRYGGQLARGHILAELVQDVALGDAHLACGVAILVT